MRLGTAALASICWARQKLRKKKSAGDLVFVHQPLTAPSRSKILPKRLFDARGHEDVRPNLLEIHPDEDKNFFWALKPHDKSSPVEVAGQYYLQLQIKDNLPFNWRRYVSGPAD